ncbi:MAG TPA: restriction endonuclease subunit S [Bacteroidia bacterium]|nr:restriction endonuclease subunit S [Bacteroidia bacterium]HRS58816.1 restriction endonuclease subunit S [Bacteroidia bacterium]HRU69370.1 restriction endonuclease subunit S [Bacteroidia bacterium]
MIKFIDESYTLPEGWTASKLVELAEIHDNRRKPINALERANMKGIYPYCGANNIVDYINKFEFDGEFVLIAEDGGYWGKNENTSYIMTGKFWVNNHAHIIRAIKGKSTNQYLSYVLNYLNLEPIIGGDARGKLTKSILTELLIPHPVYTEQRKIAYVLSTVQKAIEQQDKLIKTTTELKKALMQKLFTEGIGWLSGAETSLKQTEIGPVPESWEVVKIESLFNIQQGKQVSKSNRIGANQKPFLRTANIYWGNIDFRELDKMHFSKEEEKKYKLEKNDLLVCEGGDVGRTAIWKYDIKNIYYQNHIHRLRSVSDEIIPKYFMYWMNYIVVETSYVKDAGNKTTIPNLSKSRLGGLIFPKPNIEYQTQSVQLLESLDNKLEFHQKKKQTLSDLFKTLLHELMTGERRVHEIEFEKMSAPLTRND